MQRFEVVSRHEHRGGFAVFGDRDDVVRALGAVDERGELVLGFAERHRRHASSLADKLARN